MTFTELKTEIMDRLNLSSTDAETRVGRSINRKYRSITTDIGMELSRRSVAQVNVTMGSSIVTFTNTEKIITVVNRAVSPYRLLVEVMIDELEAGLPFVAGDHPTKFAVYSHTADTVSVMINCVPQTAFTLYADVHQVVADLSGSNEPAFPESYHNLIVEGVMFDELRKMEKPQLAAMAQKEYERLFSNLQMWNAKSAYLDIYQGKVERLARTGSTGSSSSSSSVNGASSYTQTGLITFDRDPADPFIVTSGSGKVDNLDADLLDGQEGTAYHDASLLTGTLGALSGANLTALNATQLTSGTVPDARFPATLPVASGVNLTALNATQLTSGTVPDARFPATLPALSGVNLTALNATQLTSGSVPDARIVTSTTSTTSSSTGAQNDWAPTVSGRQTFINWSGASAMAATGLAGGTTGMTVTIYNGGSSIATFTHSSGSSSAANRFINRVTSGPTPIAAKGYVTYRHDGTNWKLVGHDQGAWITPTFNAGDFTVTGGTSWTVASGDVSAHAYKLTGNSLLVAWYFATTTVAGTPSTLNSLIPGGFTSGGRITANATSVSDNNGGHIFGRSQVSASATVINHFRSANAVWSVSTNLTELLGELTFEVA